MTRNEILRYISNKSQLADHINKLEGENFTRLKTTVLEKYIEEYEGMTATPVQKPSTVNNLKSAVIAFLVTLDQKGVLDGLLAEIK